jgi:pimeloyl-ACP methyl ester carboxylesterase
MIDTRWSLKRRFEYQGQSIAYDVLGEGVPIVLVHGTPFSSYVWRMIARELARNFKVYLYDLLGYGQSEKRKGQDVSLGVQNDAFVALIDHWNLVTPNVIAHDFGGATVLRAHLINRCDYNKPPFPRWTR